MSYKGIPENQTGTVIKVITVSQEYINCKKDVDKFYWSIKKLIDSVKSVSRYLHLNRSIVVLLIGT